MLGRGRYSIDFGRTTVHFDLIFGDHDYFKVVVSPDLRVEVHAPQGKPLDQVLERVKRKAAWISRQVHYFEKYQPRLPEKRYVSGETVRFLGRQYRLKVVRSTEANVKLVGGYLVVQARDRRSDIVRDSIQQWYKDHAKSVFAKRLERCVEKVRRQGIKQPDIIIRKMRTRWGSCTTSKSILLNTDLVQAPVHCIDYVITHELCHTRHRNHTPAFYRLLNSVMPDWQARKERLEEAVRV